MEEMNKTSGEECLVAKGNMRRKARIALRIFMDSIHIIKL